jgi:hypothetical protein
VDNNFKMKSKRGLGGLVWILIVLALVAVGVGIYFLVSGDGSSIIGGSNSVPQPPALPN